jgi:hypothetical protein
MTTVPRLVGLIALAGLGLLTCSCGRKGRKAVYPTRTRVVNADGKPVAGATVVFHPLDAPDDARHKPAGTSDADGNVALTTYVANDGAPAGEYAVTVEWRPAPKGPADDPPDRLNGKFRDPKTSPFKASVKKEPNELPPIKLP